MHFDALKQADDSSLCNMQNCRLYTLWLISAPIVWVTVETMRVFQCIQTVTGRYHYRHVRNYDVI